MKGEVVAASEIILVTTASVQALSAIVIALLTRQLVAANKQMAEEMAGERMFKRFQDQREAADALIAIINRARPMIDFPLDPANVADVGNVWLREVGMYEDRIEDGEVRDRINRCGRLLFAVRMADPEEYARMKHAGLKLTAALSDLEDSLVAYRNQTPLPPVRRLPHSERVTDYLVDYHAVTDPQRFMDKPDASA